MKEGSKMGKETMPGKNLFSGEVKPRLHPGCSVNFSEVVLPQDQDFYRLPHNHQSYPISPPWISQTAPGEMAPLSLAHMPEKVSGVSP